MPESFTKEDREKVSRFLSTVNLSEGVGFVETPCSIAAINLALTGNLTDDCPPCMSPIIYRFIIEVQDAAGYEMRNSREWKALLPWAAGSLDEEEIERERLSMMRDWMWDSVLPKLKPAEDFKDAWATMLQGRSREAAKALWLLTGGREDVIGDGYSHTVASEVENAYVCFGREIPLVNSQLGSMLSAAEYVAESLAGSCPSAVHAAWRSFEPAALLRRLIEHPHGLPAGWEA
jgi:hypothetical protein